MTGEHHHRGDHQAGRPPPAIQVVPRLKDVRNNREALLQREGPRPLHEQMSSRIRSLIASGSWPPHFKLPAEPDLAAEMGVSRGTLRRAMSTLTGEGLLVQVRGKGTFVTSTAIEQPIAQELLSLSEAMDQQGIVYTTEVLSAAIAPISHHVSALLGQPRTSRAFRLVRRRVVGGVPVAFLINYVRLDQCPGIDAKDFAQRSLFKVLEEDYRVTIATARRTFEAQGASPDTALQLDVPEGAALLYLEQVAYLGSGQPVEYSDVWIRGDKLRLSSLLERRQPAAPREPVPVISRYGRDLSRAMAPTEERFDGDGRR